jgi:hypothetical protein
MENLRKNKTTIMIAIATIVALVPLYLIFRFTPIVSAAIEFPVNAPIVLTAKISNRGTITTGIGFNNYFQIASDSNGGGTIVEEPADFLSPLLSNLTGSISTTHTFTTIGAYSVRACADKTNDVSETSELNNCGPWLNILIVALPTPTDSCENGADNPTGSPSCTTFGGVCLNNATNPPECTNSECTNGADNPPLCDNSTTTAVNACLLIEQNPLTFTPEEKARLAILLRRFYLISSTLKTTEDISTIYSEIDQQKNFINQIEELTQQCYAQVNMSKNINWVRHGNPWYKPETGGTFPYTNGNTGYFPHPATYESFAERILNIW